LSLLSGPSKWCGPTSDKQLLLAALQAAAGLPALTGLRLMTRAPDGCRCPPDVTKPRCEELERLRSASLRELTLHLDQVRLLP